MSISKDNISKDNIRKYSFSYYKKYQGTKSTRLKALLFYKLYILSRLIEVAAVRLVDQPSVQVLQNGKFLKIKFYRRNYVKRKMSTIDTNYLFEFNWIRHLNVFSRK